MQLSPKERDELCRIIDDGLDEKSEQLPIALYHAAAVAHFAPKTIAELAKKVDRLERGRELLSMIKQVGKTVQESDTSKLKETIGARLRAAHPIWLIHGGTSGIWLQVQETLRGSGYTTFEFNDFASIALIPDRVKALCERCRIAVAVMTAEPGDGTRFPRPNVCHEIGMAHAVMGLRNVLLFKDVEVEPFTNLAGIVYINFSPHQIVTGIEELMCKIEGLITG